MAVTLNQIVDPATGATSFAPDAGDRFVALRLVLQNPGSTTVSDDANADTALQGSNGQIYQPDFSDVAGCTNFDAGDFSLAPGGSAVGCVVFQLPVTGVAATTVSFRLGNGQAVTWTSS